MRKWKNNEQIKAMAKELSQKIYVKTNQGEMWRRSTEAESESLFEIFYPALMTLNYFHSEQGAGQRKLDDGVVNMAEFSQLVKLPNANSYITTYCPLKEVLRTWEEE